MDKLIRYLPDETGQNQDNLVKNEPHHLPVQVRGRVIVPDHGSFFGDSVVVRDRLSGRELTRGKDFVCAGLRTKQSKVAEGPIYSIILVTDDKCSTEILVDYQVYGGDIFQFVEPTIELLQESFETNEGIPLAKLLNLPTGWAPTFHYHDLGNIDKFDFMLFCIDRIRNTMLLNNNELFKFLLDFEKMLHLLSAKANSQFEFDLFSAMREFTENFGQQIFGLEKVKNYPLMVDNDGIAIATKMMSVNIIEDKEGYLNLGILAEYSKKFFEFFVNIEDTNIGSSKERTIHATTESFEAMPIGSIFTINDYNFAEIAGNPELETFYPDRIDRTNGYAIRKLCSAESKVGSLYLYTGRNNGRTYILRLADGENGLEGKFRYIANSVDQPNMMAEILLHMEDMQNPHNDDKRDVDLAQVENLPVASKEDLICNMPVRKYLTVESILQYMKRFKTGKKDTFEIYENLSERSARKQMQTIFSPCGAWDDNLDVSKIELCRLIDVTTTPAPLDPKWSVEPDVEKLDLVFDRNWSVTPDREQLDLVFDRLWSVEPDVDELNLQFPPPSTFNAHHYGDFINGDGIFFFSVVDPSLQNGDLFFINLHIRVDNGETYQSTVGVRGYGERSLVVIMPPHSPAGGNVFNFTTMFYEAKLEFLAFDGMTGQVGEKLGESAWIKCYNLAPQIDFSTVNIELVYAKPLANGLSSSLVVDGYYDPRYVNTVDYYKQWLGYRKSSGLLDFGTWFSTSNTPQPGKSDIYLNEYFNGRNSSNYEKSHIDPDTGEPRPLIIDLYSYWFTDDGVEIPGSLYPSALPYKDFDLKVRFSFYRNGIPTPMISEMYLYSSNFGLPAGTTDDMVGAFTSKIEIGHNRSVLIRTGNQLNSPPPEWLDEINGEGSP